MLTCGLERAYRDLCLGDHVPQDKSRGPFLFSVIITTEEYPDNATSLFDLIRKRSAQYAQIWIDVHRGLLANSVKVDG